MRLKKDSFYDITAVQSFWLESTTLALVAGNHYSSHGVSQMVFLSLYRWCSSRNLAMIFFFRFLFCFANAYSVYLIARCGSWFLFCFLAKNHIVGWEVTGWLQTRNWNVLRLRGFIFWQFGFEALNFAKYLSARVQCTRRVIEVIIHAWTLGPRRLLKLRAALRLLIFHMAQLALCMIDLALKYPYVFCILYMFLP